MGGINRSRSQGLSTLLTLVALLVTATSCAYVIRATTPTGGGPANAESRDPTISASGQMVAFVSAASNLVGGDTNAQVDVFVRDNSTSTTRLVSHGLAGLPADGDSSSAVVSANGQAVAFVSAASNLVIDDTNGAADVFVWDSATGNIERASVTDGEEQLAWSSAVESCFGSTTDTCAPITQGLALNDNGSQVAFISRDPVTSVPAVLWRDRTGAHTSTAVSPTVLDSERYVEVAMSGDGSTLAYSAEAATDPGSASAVDPAQVGLRVLDRATSTTQTIVAPDTNFASDGCCHPSIATTGRYIAFATNGVLVPEDDDVSGCPSDVAHCALDVDVFVFDRQLNTSSRVSVSATGAEIDGGASRPSISGNGQRVLWSSSSSAINGTPAGVQQVYLRDVGAATTTLASQGFHGAANATTDGVLAADGLVVALHTASTLFGDVETLVAPEIFTALADQPRIDGPVTGAAGMTNSTAVITGSGFTPSMGALPLGDDLSVSSVLVLSPTQLQLTYSTPAGASLGLRQLLIYAAGPFNLKAATLCVCLNLTWQYDAGNRPADQPDIIVINTDDQRFDSMSQLPLMQGRGGWTRMTNSFVEEPQCCPSRSTLLTGRYAHHTQVTTLRNGENLDDTQTVATMLQTAGYRTFLGGKYLNGYPFGTPYIPPGWDDFVAFMGENPAAPASIGENHLYWWYQTYENGNQVPHGDAPSEYSTDYYFDKSRDFIRNANPDDPLFMYVAPFGPHSPLQPAKRHQGTCAQTALPNPPNYNAYDSAGEPAWMAAATPYSVQGPYSTSGQVGQRRLTCEMLKSIDENVVSLLDELQAAGRLNNAYVIFTSDNGYLFGEHRLEGKGNLFEESIRVPMWVRGPDSVPGNVSRLTSNVDITPTVLDWAGVAAPTGFLDGQSFADDVRGQNTIPNPDAVLLFGCRSSVLLGNTDCGGYREPMGTAWGVRTDRYKYVEYEDGYAQVFDEQQDPGEATNLAVNPANNALVAQLRSTLVAKRGDASGITGLVTDLNGAPLAGIEVLLSPVGGTWSYKTRTASNGRYSFFLLPPGTYYVRFDDPSGTHKRQFFNNVGTLSKATAVTAGFVTVNARLKPT